MSRFSSFSPTVSVHLKHVRNFELNKNTIKRHFTTETNEHQILYRGRVFDRDQEVRMELAQILSKIERGKRQTHDSFFCLGLAVGCLATLFYKKHYKSDEK